MTIDIRWNKLKKGRVCVQWLGSGLRGQFLGLPTLPYLAM